jgi:F0F1-type ATP synthase membrane subunit a
MIMSFILLYGIDLSLILIGSIVLYGLYRQGRVELVKKIIYNLVEEAEIVLSEPKSGSMKYIYVIERIYNILPLSLRLLYTKQEMDNFIELAVATLKTKLKG